MIIKPLDLFLPNSLGDFRLSNRGNLLVSQLIDSGHSVVNRMFADLKGRIGAYRFLQNPKVTTSKLMKAIKQSCLAQLPEGEPLLVIQDTTELNFGAHQARIEKSTRKPEEVSKGNAGFFLHASIAVSARSGEVYGTPHVETYSWDPDRIRKRDYGRVYKDKPLRQRSSYRWISTTLHTGNALCSNHPVTVVCDREGDAFELLSMKRKPNQHLLIRSSTNRRLKDGGYLQERMEQAPLACTYTFTLPSRGHGHRKREVQMALRFATITLSKPFQGKGAALDGKAPESLTLYCVYAHEVGTPPKGEDPVTWRLFTTHEVTTAEMARQCVEWYRMRWLVEEVFRVLKSGGFAIEEAQLESLKSLKKLALMALFAAVRVVSLKVAFDRPDEGVSAVSLFTPQEIALIKRSVLPKMEGSTQRQKNPFKPETLPWVAWAIARLGGWSGYLSQSKPGYITFKNGLDKLNLLTAFLADH